jgi:hypothetical protein
MYNHRNDTCLEKQTSRNIRLDYSKAWVKLNDWKAGLTCPFVFSLPGTSGKYEKEMVKFFQSNEMSAAMIGFEKCRDRFNITLPLGSTVKPETDLIKSTDDGRSYRIETYWPNGKSNIFLEYCNSKIDSATRGMGGAWDRFELKNPAPILLDGDFCGYFNRPVIDCLKYAGAGSLVTLTFFCKFRGMDKLSDTIPTPQKQFVTAHDMAVMQRDGVEQYFKANNIPFTRLEQYEYSNNRSPMVLLVYHLRENSPLLNANIEKPKTFADESSRKVDLIARRNAARLLVKEGKLSNVEIDRKLTLPPYTAAGFDASAKRYGKHVLDKVETVD